MTTNGRAIRSFARIARPDSITTKRPPRPAASISHRHACLMGLPSFRTTPSGVTMIRRREKSDTATERAITPITTTPNTTAGGAMSLANQRSPGGASAAMIGLAARNNTPPSAHPSAVASTLSDVATTLT
jgi:hypothetical protein